MRFLDTAIHLPVNRVFRTVMTVGFNVLAIALPAMEIAGFLLLLWGFVGLKKITTSDTGKTTLVGEIRPNLIKLGLILIIIGISLGLALRFIPCYF